MKILISIFLLSIFSLASASVLNTCVDAEGKKITTDQPCEKLSLKDANTLATPAPAAVSAALPASTADTPTASGVNEGAGAFLVPALPKVTVERKIPRPPMPNPWLELIHTDYSYLIMIGACPFLFALFWYLFEYRMRRR